MRAAAGGFEHLAVDVIDLLRRHKAFGEASRSLAGTADQQQEQQDGEHAGAVAEHHRAAYGW